MSLIFALLSLVGHCWGIQSTGSSNVLTPAQTLSGGLVTGTIAANGALTISTSATPGSAVGNIGINTSGQVTFSVPLSSFAVTAALSGTFTNAVLQCALAASTVTLNLPAGTSGIVHVAFNGSIADGTLAANISAGILVDGGYVNGQTSAKGLVSDQQAVAGDNSNMGFDVIITGLAAGSHNFCLGLLVSAGTGTLDSTNSTSKLSVNTMP